MTALEAVSAYLPDRRVPIEDLAGRLELTDRQVKVFRRFHGLGEVCRQPPGDNLLDLLLGATAGLGLAGRERRVRYLLYARGISVAVPYPLNPLHELRRLLGLDRAVAFTVTHHACATGLLAVEMAGRMLAADGDPDALALVVAGEKTFTRDAELVPETSVFGEGAGACLVRLGGERDRLLSYATRIRGDFDGRLAEQPDLLLRFQREYPETLAEVITAAAGRAGVSLADISLVLPHNVNSVSWRNLCRRLDFPVERVLLDNVPRTGHNFAADLFVNYRTAVERGLLSPGDHYLVAAVGLGAMFSAMVFEH